MNPTKKALVVIAPGFEEMEAIAPIDLLRRAGVVVTIATIGADRTTTGRNGITLMADACFELDSQEVDLIVVPGGPGFKLARQHAPLLERLRRQHAAGKWIGSICAGPVVLADAGILAGRRHTCHVSVADELPRRDANRVVVRDGNVITSQGAGTATEFALALVAALCGEEVALRIAGEIAWAHEPAQG